MVGGSLQVLQLRPPLKLGAMILLKVALSTIKQIKSNILTKKKQVPFLSIVKYIGLYELLGNLTT
jgi:hypothetical protein